MAEERKMDTTQKVTAAEPKKPTAKPAPKKAAGGNRIATLRADLSAARRDLALNKLDSPAKIRSLRKELARALTAENVKKGAA
jgi:ribosomal protein L29